MAVHRSCVGVVLLSSVVSSAATITVDRDGNGDFADPSRSGVATRMDGDAGITDAIAILGYLFRGAPPPAYLDAADADDSGRLNISDAIFVLIHEFLGGPGPGDLLPGCSIDPVVDGLDCQEYTGCG